ncbi:MAG: MFS transporter [Proteobacteria bacterium]|nr:MFS transporter [Pseudomonadota bacterium]
MEKLTQEVVPILILVTAIALVIRRLPKVELGHSEAFKRRRVMNWLPLGLTYAFLYMGRYNIVELMNQKAITGKEFGDIDAVGSIVYGLAFLLNGPLTDRWGGRVTILIAASGAAVCNVAIGFLVSAGDFQQYTAIGLDKLGWPELQTIGTFQGGAPSLHMLMLLFAVNMYFQSFGAVAIVKVNASWFHLRERGTFGGIFGVLISLGLYLAFDWAPKIASLTSLSWLFFAPGLILIVFFVLSYIWVRDTPAKAGLEDFDVADASSGDEGPADRAVVIIKRMLTSKILLTIAFISLCSGFLRQGILKWYKTFADGVRLRGTFVFDHWGMVSCVCGITGGMFAGIISDQLFKSRRPPVAVVLFSCLLAGSIAIVPLLGVPGTISFVIAFMAMAVIGVHGMLSGVASQDFGGRRNAGTATGLIDGFVYFGTALQGFIYARLLPERGTDEAKDVANWVSWPVAMIPMAVIGLALSIWIIKAVVLPNKPTQAAH